MFKNIIDIIFNKKENNVYDRPSFNEVFFAVARIWRLRSTCLRTKVGACLVKDNQILATGYNGNPIGMPHCSNDPDSKYYCPKMKVDAEHGTADELCTAVHAEMNCILQTSKEDRVGSVLYCTHSPCSTCAKLIVESGISVVHYIEGYPDTITSKLFESAGIPFIKHDEIKL